MERNTFRDSAVFVIVFFTPIIVPCYYFAGNLFAKVLGIPASLCSSGSLAYVAFAMVLSITGVIFSGMEVWTIEKHIYQTTTGISGWAVMGLILLEYGAFWYGDFIGMNEYLLEFGSETRSNAEQNDDEFDENDDDELDEDDEDDELDEEDDDDFDEDDDDDLDEEDDDDFDEEDLKAATSEQEPVPQSAPVPPREPAPAPPPSSNEDSTRRSLDE